QHLPGQPVGDPCTEQQGDETKRGLCVGVAGQRLQQCVVEIERIFHRYRVAAERSIITPTARAPRTAPGLESFNATCCTPNSSRMIAATRSARVSTRPNSDADTYSITRLLTAL